MGPSVVDMTHYTDRTPQFTRIVEGVTDWSAPTPCAGWTARDLLDHVISTQRDFLAKHDLSVPEVDLADPAAAWRAHTEAVVSTLAADGVAEREFDGYFGRTTIGATMGDFYGWDLVVHGWDLARATGQEWSLTDAEVEQMMTTADGWGDALYSEGVCGPAVEVAADAPAQDRLLARLGRDPRWAAQAA